MNTKYKIQWYGGMFDMMVKSKKYHDMKESDSYDDMKKLRYDYFSKHLLPSLRSKLDLIIEDAYSMHFDVERITFKCNKSDHEKYIIIELFADEKFYTVGYIKESHDDIMRQLHNDILNSWGVVSSSTKVYL